MTGSYALANFPSFECELLHFTSPLSFSDSQTTSLALRDEVWDLEETLFGPQVKNPTVGQDSVLSTTTKAAAGYPVSVVDPCSYLLFHT